LSPWVAQAGKWTVSGGVLNGGLNKQQTYGSVYLTNSWTNYSVQAQLQFPAGAYGGGVGGFVNPTTGARYAAWVYPEGSPGGSSVLKLLKYQTWTTWSYKGSNSAPMQQVNLGSVGTSWHTLKLAFTGNQITVSYDTNQLISVADSEATPYTRGGISVDIWKSSAKYTLLADNVVVNSLATGSGVLPNISNVPPVIESILLAQGSLVITWSAVSSNTYRLQYTDGLGTGTWNNTLQEVLATGSTMTTTNAIGNAPQRFYRVLLLQ
jgi:hypothetical protein